MKLFNNGRFKIFKKKNVSFGFPMEFSKYAYKQQNRERRREIWANPDI